MYVEQFTNNFCHLTKNKLSLLNNKHNLNIKKLYFFYNKIVQASKFAAILQKEIVGEFVELNSEQRNTLFTNEHLLSSSVYFSDKKRNSIG